MLVLHTFRTLAIFILNHSAKDATFLRSLERIPFFTTRRCHLQERKKCVGVCSGCVWPRLKKDKLDSYKQFELGSSIEVVDSMHNQIVYSGRLHYYIATYCGQVNTRKV